MGEVRYIPLDAYRCEDCGAFFQIDVSPNFCPECGSEESCKEDK